MSIEIQPNIRKAQVQDSRNLASLANKAFKGYPFEYVFSEDGTKEAIARGEQRWVILNENNQITGCAVLGLTDSRMAEVMRVMIDPSLRKNGAATYLTKRLSLEAINEGKYAWADVRGDQIGMQRAGMGASMKAISLEQGKHVVYNHKDSEGRELGPARETMVHMTTLPVNELDLKNEIVKLPYIIREQLAKNLKSSLNPTLKDQSLSAAKLPNAKTTKERVLNSINYYSEKIGSIVSINNDIKKIETAGINTIVVLPDASAFILNGGHLDETVNLLTAVGIQVATYYCDLNDEKMRQKAIDAGMEAASIRPWVNEKTGQIVWQIAWRKTANDYKDCLHTISLDPIVERQIMKIINIVEK